MQPSDQHSNTRGLTRTNKTTALCTSLVPSPHSRSQLLTFTFQARLRPFTRSRRIRFQKSKSLCSVHDNRIYLRVCTTGLREHNIEDKTRRSSAQLFANHRAAAPVPSRDCLPGCRGAFLARHDPFGRVFNEQAVTVAIFAATQRPRISLITRPRSICTVVFPFVVHQTLEKPGSGGS